MDYRQFERSVHLFDYFISLLVIRAYNYSVGVESVSDRRALREKLGI